MGSHYIFCVFVLFCASSFACMVIPTYVGPYLIVATDRKLAGKIDNQDIYEVSGFEIIPFMASTHHLTEAQVSLMFSMCVCACTCVLCVHVCVVCAGQIITASHRTNVQPYLQCVRSFFSWPDKTSRQK